MNTEQAIRPRVHRVLVVDDNPSIHSDFRKILCPEGGPSNGSQELEAVLFEDHTQFFENTSFELESAFQGQDALEMARKGMAEGHPYSLAFVDVRMPPGWDGIQTIARLWELDPRLQVVVCTAYSDYSWQQMRSRLGKPDSLLVVKKPFDNIEVQQLAHALTRKWELNRQAELRMQDLENMVATRTAELETANENLARSEERFGKAFHTSPVPMAIQSLPDDRFVDVNEAMLALTGRSREEIINSTARSLGIWHTPAMVEEWAAGLLRNETIRQRETEVRNAHGELHQVLLSMSSVTLAGQAHALLVAQDITERNLLERQLRQAQKMEAIGQLAAGVAHDFNNILTVIQGHAGLLRNQLKTCRGSLDSADKIAKAVDRAAGLVRQLLMFSRKQVMQFRHLDLNETVSNSISMIHRLVGEHIRLDFQPGTGLPAVHGDSTMMEQVIMNLALNARDAMPDGGLVTISTDVANIARGAIPMDPEERNGQFVCLSFSDTGCGMNTAVLNRIFEPFFTTKAVGKGTGLGLSTVFGIVRQHGGWIEVTSKPGQGSVFRLYFPPSAKPAEQTQNSYDADLNQRGRETVLVVEDEEALREMVSLVLNAQGYKVLDASSGVEALKIYEQANQHIDLLLTDLVMPGGVMGGDLAARLKARNPAMKVVFTSGYSPGMAGKDISLMEGRNFLPKPYPIGKLAQFVRNVLDQHPERLAPDPNATSNPPEPEFAALGPEIPS